MSSIAKANLKKLNDMCVALEKKAVSENSSLKKLVKKLEKNWQKVVGKVIYVGTGVTSQLSIFVYCDNKDILEIFPNEVEGFPVEKRAIPRAY
jgi:hypothetical protein